jgi:hypothetical protein
VSRPRYNVALILFVLPILFAWVSLYAADYNPGFGENRFAYAIGGDFYTY